MSEKLPVQKKPILDKLPDGLLLKILGYAMLSDEPFFMERFLNCVNDYHERTKSKDREIWITFPWDTKMPFSERLYQRLGSSLGFHILDWWGVTNTSKRIRRVGKEAFFANKVFMMEPRLAEKLGKGQLTRFSAQDQEIAAKSIRSFIFPEDVTSPSDLLTVPRCLPAFPKLEFLGHLFYSGKDEKGHVLSRVSEVDTYKRGQVPSEFVDALASIGVPTHKLDMKMMVEGEMHRADCVKKLTESVSPLLKSLSVLKMEWEAKKKNKNKAT